MNFSNNSHYTQKNENEIFTFLIGKPSIFLYYILFYYVTTYIERVSKASSKMSWGGTKNTMSFSRIKKFKYKRERERERERERGRERVCVCVCVLPVCVCVLPVCVCTPRVCVCTPRVCTPRVCVYVYSPCVCVLPACVCVCVQVRAPLRAEWGQFGWAAVEPFHLTLTNGIPFRETNT